MGTRAPLSESRTLARLLILALIALTGAAVSQPLLQLLGWSIAEALSSRSSAHRCRSRGTAL